MYLLSLTCLLACLAQGAFCALQLAFPEAEGFGRYAQGGRTGSSYVVSTLADSGPGSLREGVSEPGRIITFNISGIIKIKSRIVVSKSTTILGQTAPGRGITVYGNGWSFSNADHSILRYLRIRMGKGGDKGKDAITIAHGHNMMFDHVSISWGRDETFSINGENAGNITIQNCIVAQGLETHSAGGLLQTNGGLSIFRNLYTDNKTRNPKVKGKNDFVNNVVYNWGGGGGYIAGGSEGLSEANIVGNYFIAGPSTGSTAAFVRGNDNFHASVKGNYVDHDKDGQLNGKELPVDSKSYGGINIVKNSFGYPGPARVMTAPEALKEVLHTVGASKVRDAVDDYLLKEVQSWGKSGKLISDEDAPPMAGLMGSVVGRAGTRATEKTDMLLDMQDSDEDGIPDWYESKMGWDLNKNDATTIDRSGYTRIELYANHLVFSTYSEGF